MKVEFKVESPANIALIKYWGMSDSELILPANPSISFNLSGCKTVSKFGYGEEVVSDSYLFDGESSDSYLAHIDRVRRFFAGKGFMMPYVEVSSSNNFMAANGMASSASSYSALTFGLFELARRFGARFEFSDLVNMTRLSGSASAVRSLKGGFVGYDPADSGCLVEVMSGLELCDVVCVVSNDEKKVSSREGHARALSSNFWSDRIEGVRERYGAVCDCLGRGDFELLCKVVEDETWSFLINHFTCSDPINYLVEASLRVVSDLKEQGFNFFYTFDAGSSVHIICLKEDANEIAAFVGEVDGVLEYSLNEMCDGVRLIS